MNTTIKNNFQNVLSTYIIFILTIILFTGLLNAQVEQNSNLVSIKTLFNKENLKAGDERDITVKVTVEDEWHINSNKPNDDFLIPTILKLTSTNLNLVIKSIKYPVAMELKFDFSDKPVSVYEKDFIIEAKVKLPETAKPGSYKLNIALNYQACNNSTCLPPNSVSQSVPFEIYASQSDSLQNKDTVAQKSDMMLGETNKSAENFQKAEIQQKDSTTSDFEKSGLLLSLILVFLGGLALNLTPCVYPLIPITVGYFGGQSEGSTKKLFTLGVLYVLGMAFTYSVIGVITALSGAVFGALLQNTFVILAIVAVLIALSLSMFGLYEFKLPDSWVAKAGGAKGGYFGALFMGLTMGIVAAPCIGPFVLGLVTYVGAKGDPFYGFLMFFTLAVGLGLPYLFLALFSGKIKSLPRAGFWMDAIKHIFGFILLGMALYFALPLIPKEISKYVLPVYMILAALYILIFDKSAKKVKGFRIFKTVLSVIIIIAGVYFLIPSKEVSPEWKVYSDTSFEQSKAANQPIMIDFYADWCIPCKELDAITYSDQKVIDEAARFDNYKVDMTKSLSEETEKIRNKFKIVGMPTIILINSRGQEVKRLTGFVKPEEFLSILKAVD
ncbi:MAG: thiol:disulfide interchange protein [Ignavibacteriales bacterium]|nr:MAG: thiol:disulfide interchange protein [Ignavibacteriales bacterium]